MPKYGRAIYSVYTSLHGSALHLKLLCPPPHHDWFAFKWDHQKTLAAQHWGNVQTPKIQFLHFFSKRKSKMLKWSIFQGFSSFCILSVLSSRVSCHGPLFWLQEKNFFVLITRKSQGKNFFCPPRRFVHCNNSGGSVSTVMGLLLHSKYPSLTLKHHLPLCKTVLYVPIKYPSTLTLKHHSLLC